MTIEQEIDTRMITTISSNMGEVVANKICLRIEAKPIIIKLSHHRIFREAAVPPSIAISSLFSTRIADITNMLKMIIAETRPV